MGLRRHARSPLRALRKHALRARVELADQARFLGPASDSSGLSNALDTVIRNRGLESANLNLGMTVPQGVNASFFHQLDARWALLGSVGWQQWSKFGEVEIGIDSSNPVGVTNNLDFKDTWHVAAGAQYQLDSPWRLDFGVAYDSEFQDSSNVSPMLPANSAWRFGFGAQKQESQTFYLGSSRPSTCTAAASTSTSSRTRRWRSAAAGDRRFVSERRESCFLPRISTGSSERSEEQIEGVERCQPKSCSETSSFRRPRRRHG